MEHPDNPLLDVALNAIREGATNTNPIQVEHIALAVEAVRAERDALAAKVARVEALADDDDPFYDDWDKPYVHLSDLRAALTDEPTHEQQMEAFGEMG